MRTEKATHISKTSLLRIGDLMLLSELDYVGIAVPITGLAIAVLKLYLDERQARKEIKMSKQGLVVLSQLVKSYEKGRDSALQLEREKLGFEQWKAAAKAIGWVFDHLESEEE